jgi:hypothetical protein
MNEGDCFILDIGAELLMWSGKQASRREKIKVTRDIFLGNHTLGILGGSASYIFTTCMLFHRRLKL